MRKIYLMVFALLAFGAMMGFAEINKDKDNVDRGKYIVTRVAMCVDCHTPMGPNGPDETKAMGGAPIMFEPKVELPKFGTYAPNLTKGGLLGKWTDLQLVTFLTSGKDIRDNYAYPPMPAYRLSADDAQEVVDYLKSLPAVESPKPKI